MSLLRLTGLKKDGTPYNLIVNTDTLVSIGDNGSGMGNWKSVVTLKDGKRHFVAETFKNLTDQLTPTGASE